ncbi:hypothetical protein BTA51_15865 [Hahella sp. CCB-MM4]|uniref:hypothetical protein n=1 Tax=Hahella sp. (strain CCB-MM4) TaxID=1926491 RepID=UPI000B9A5890|nr:hypothetical protein [Hahella sp. CCB-MM4]OZG72584.1 hypothetical protein BTA51_15865 [Hahella sp. CCB-MM4]
MSPDDIYEAIYNLDFSELKRTDDPLIIEIFLINMFAAFSDAIADIELDDLQLAIDKMRPYNEVKANHYQAELLSNDEGEEFERCLLKGIENGCVGSMYSLVEASGEYEELFEGLDKHQRCSCMDSPEKK